MNSREEEKNELRQYGFSGEVLQQLYELTDVNDYDGHLDARRRFVDSGEAVLPVMHQLLHSKQEVIRKQALKVVELIAHHSSIGDLLDMLEDNVSGIRWIAAETLIKIGRPALRPLLEALIERSDIYNFRLGTHHVLAKLVSKSDPPELQNVEAMTRSGGATPETIPVHAAHALKQSGF